MMSNDVIKLNMDDTLNDGDNDGSEFEHGNVEDGYDKTFKLRKKILFYKQNILCMSRTFYVSPEHIIFIIDIYGYVENFRQNIFPKLHPKI